MVSSSKQEYDSTAESLDKCTHENSSNVIIGNAGHVVKGRSTHSFTDKRGKGTKKQSECCAIRPNDSNEHAANGYICVKDNSREQSMMDTEVKSEPTSSWGDSGLVQSNRPSHHTLPSNGRMLLNNISVARSLVPGLRHSE